jgi:methyl-accepting chemotaxis protein
MIERVMLNLISNAIKFSNPNGEIYVNVINKIETIEITVKDTGVGIEKQHLDNIFNKFYQKDKSLSRNAEGSGIGLSLIKSLVELHGGNMCRE